MERVVGRFLRFIDSCAEGRSGRVYVHRSVGRVQGRQRDQRQRHDSYFPDQSGKLEIGKVDN